MSKASCVVRLEGKEIDGDIVSCTGNQLGLIIKSLSPLSADCIWFGVDINASYPIPENYRETVDPVNIGNSEELFNFVSQVPQFLSGVFLAVPVNYLPIEWPRLFETEDKPFDEMGEIRFEIRAFDTSYIEIYAQNPDQIQRLSEQFQVEIEYP